jgi:hypothetical protein
MPKSKIQKRAEAEKRRIDSINNSIVSDILSVNQSGDIEENIPLVSIDIKENVTGKIVVGYPYSQKAFDLGQSIPRHHSTGLVGEFPHKIFY